jgi:uncharacterized membrane protein YhaH (DUF805 family)
MSSFSIWHWVIVIAYLAVPLIFILRRPPEWPNRFGSAGQPVGFGGAVGSYFSNYVNFSGRASRSEFWYSLLFAVIVSLVLLLIFPALSTAWSVVTFLPSTTVGTGRLHDINRNGWLQLLAFGFPVGTIVLFVWWCLPPRHSDANELVEVFQ